MKNLKHVLRNSAALAALLTLGLTPSFTHFSFAAGTDEEYDRLDGMGSSGKKVQVIEWEGNLEVHVYPPGSLKGLALTIDRKTKDKPVMVIGYRFNDNPQKQLIRRAIIDGISLTDAFHVYKDTTEGEFDKIVITNNNLDQVLTSFKLEPKPTQLYPDGHPALVAQAAPDAARKPAASEDQMAKGKLEQAQEDQQALQDSGSIHPFMSDRGGPQRGR